jgi:hypothetical protein
VQTAAALALGQIDSDEAREALKKGLRTLNRRVRDACLRALVRSGRWIDDRRSDPPAPAQAVKESERDRIEEEELLSAFVSSPRESGPALEPKERVLGRGFRVLRASESPPRLPSSAIAPLVDDPNDQ